MRTYSLSPIGIIHSPYKEKFAVPRQPGLVSDGGGELVLLPPYNQRETVRGLSDFSHIWLLFIFNQTLDGGWRPTVRPPRLGGNTRMGVFATRSTFRPNPIGMSLVELTDISYRNNSVILQLGSLDLVDGTPIIDIKPYLPFAESHPDARSGFAPTAPTADIPVYFTEEISEQLDKLDTDFPNIRRFITHVLAQDPRPAYRKQEGVGRTYAVKLLNFNVRWRVTSQGFEVFALESG